MDARIRAAERGGDRRRLLIEKFRAGQKIKYEDGDIVRITKIRHPGSQDPGMLKYIGKTVRLSECNGQGTVCANSLDEIPLCAGKLYLFGDEYEPA